MNKRLALLPFRLRVKSDAGRESYESFYLPDRHYTASRSRCPGVRIADPDGARIARSSRRIRGKAVIPSSRRADE